MSTFTPEEVAKLAAAGNEVRGGLAQRAYQALVLPALTRRPRAKAVRANLQANFKGTLPDVECVAACEARFSDCSA